MPYKLLKNSRAVHMSEKQSVTLHNILHDLLLQWIE